MRPCNARTVVSGISPEGFGSTTGNVLWRFACPPATGRRPGPQAGSDGDRFLGRVNAGMRPSEGMAPCRFGRDHSSVSRMSPSRRVGRCPDVPGDDQGAAPPPELRRVSTVSRELLIIVCAISSAALISALAQCSYRARDEGIRRRGNGRGDTSKRSCEPRLAHCLAPALGLGDDKSRQLIWRRALG